MSEEQGKEGQALTHAQGHALRSRMNFLLDAGSISISEWDAYITLCENFDALESAARDDKARIAQVEKQRDDWCKLFEEGAEEVLKLRARIREMEGYKALADEIAIRAEAVEKEIGVPASVVGVSHSWLPRYRALSSSPVAQGGTDKTEVEG